MNIIKSRTVTILPVVLVASLALAACGANVHVDAAGSGVGGASSSTSTNSSSSGAPECPPGSCKTGLLCVPCCLSDADCDDGNGCTEDACNPGNAQCGHGPVPGCVSCKEDADCDDGNPCTHDRCVKSQKACVNDVALDGVPCNTAAVGNGQCMLGECCFVGSCMDPSSGTCHDACPTGTECVNFVCQ